VQVDPIKPKLKPPATKRLKLKYDILLSNHGFKFNLRRYIKEAQREHDQKRKRGRGEKGMMDDDDDEGQGLTLVHFSAQLEPCLTQENTLYTVNIPQHPLNTVTQPLRAPSIPCKCSS